MNTELLKFLDRRVKVLDESDEIEYKVLGILWASEHILLVEDGGTRHVHYSLLEILEENDED